MERCAPAEYDPASVPFPEVPMRLPLARVLLLAACFTLLAACNTLRGVGKDIEKAGEVIQDTADKSP
jgi:predicted small secreted protein